MSVVTGVPSIFWVFVWLGMSVLITFLALRVYSHSRSTVSSSSGEPAFDASGI
jgi:hypothetical protein